MAASSAAAAATPEATVAWSPEEDAELRAAVEQQGAGEWQGMAEAFSTARSADALERRWRAIREERVEMWNKKTQKRLSGHNNPKRCDVEDFMRRHPVY